MFFKLFSAAGCHAYDESTYYQICTLEEKEKVKKCTSPCSVAQFLCIDNYNYNFFESNAQMIVYEDILKPKKYIFSINSFFSFF